MSKRRKSGAPGEIGLKFFVPHDESVRAHHGRIHLVIAAIIPNAEDVLGGVAIFGVVAAPPDMDYAAAKQAVRDAIASLRGRNVLEYPALCRILQLVGFEIVDAGVIVDEAPPH